MQLNQAEVSALRELIGQTIKALKVMHLPEMQCGVDLNALLSKLKGEVTTGDATIIGHIVVKDVDGTQKVPAIRATRMISGWGLKESLDAYNKGNGTVMIPKTLYNVRAAEAAKHEFYGVLQITLDG